MLRFFVFENCTLCEKNIVAHPGVENQWFSGLKLRRCAILLRGFAHVAGPFLHALREWGRHRILPLYLITIFVPDWWGVTHIFCLFSGVLFWG